MNNRTEQRRQLALWLKEWELDRMLSDSETAEAYSDEEISVEKYCIDQKPSRLLTRQIRLLHPSGAMLRPIYVTLLKNNGNRVVVAPFGRFSTPALPGELTTGLKPPHLRILNIWNSRIIEPELVSRSWKVGMLAESIKTAALKIHALLESGQTIVRSDVGPELLHPRDPRHEYMEEESSMLDEWIKRMQIRKDNLTAYEISEPELRIAAEERASYGKINE